MDHDWRIDFAMADLFEYHWLALLLAAPCVGSFLGAVAVRLPADQPLAWAVPPVRRAATGWAGATWCRC